MNTYLSKLNPAERRFVIAVAVVLFIVVNWLMVWPHFSDWDNYKARLQRARTEYAKRQTVIQLAEKLKLEVARMQSEGSAVPAEDQATEFLRTIQSQAAASGVQFIGNSRQTGQTNQFFMEQRQTIQVQATDQQLVNFLYNLGAGNSLVRVRTLSIHPDPNRYSLNASITLVASYQKNPAAKPAAPAKTDSAKTSTPKKP
jgi:Tfp pilus assembly protein PilO